jgi:hypothetical protein
MLIDAPDFVLGHELRVLALQGDWGLTNSVGPQGGRFVIANPTRATAGCQRFLELVAQSAPDLALIPELAIPREMVPTIIDAVKKSERSLAFVGGIEGLTRAEYELLLDGIEGGQIQALDGANSAYVNALLIVLKTPSQFRVLVRAKRVPAKVESDHAPQMAPGSGPFITLALGTPPVTIMPLICAEFVWADCLWTLLNETNEAPQRIDFIPVLQHNSDNTPAKHTGPALYLAYTRGEQTGHSRFLLINQGLGEHCDGECYVIVPPNAANVPAFDHSCNELWHLPGVAAGKGFRLPDRTGCVWFAQIRSPHAPTGALGTRPCSGYVLEVFTPTGKLFQGIALGLMRSACILLSPMAEQSQPGVADAFRQSLSFQSVTYVLRALDTAAANEVVFKTKCAQALGWDSVEHVVKDLVEVSALLACGADPVALEPCDGGNCTLAGRPLLVLYAPRVDDALMARFSTATQFNAEASPSGVVLVGVTTGPSYVGATRIGEVIRADRVTTSSTELLDSPVKSPASAAAIRIDDVEFRSLTELKSNLSATNTAAARTRLQQLFPKAYA